VRAVEDDLDADLMGAKWPRHRQIGEQTGHLNRRCRKSTSALEYLAWQCERAIDVKQHQSAGLFDSHG
jgi:hypothetical protein